MDRLQNEPSSSTSSTYTAQIAKLYKEFKTSDRVKTSSKIKVFINQAGELKISEDKELLGYKKLDRKILYKQMKSEIDKGSIDHKTARTAAKALLLLPWKKPFDIKKVTSDFSFLRSTISPHKAETIEKMLDRLKGITRSEEGGNGVIFIECAFTGEKTGSYSSNIAIKFMKEGRSVVAADHLLQALGFTTPHSCYLSTESSLKTKLLDLVQNNLSLVDTIHHNQIKKQTATMPCILIMNILDNVTSFREIAPEKLIDLLQNKNIILQIGKMILIDVFMNNTDRLNHTCCNLGNFMIDDQSHLVLLDHELNLNHNNFNEVKGRLLDLLKGKYTDQILENLAGAFKYDRKKFGGITLSNELLKSMKPIIEEGMQHAARELIQVLTNPLIFKRVFQPYMNESEKINGELIVELVKWIQTIK